MTRPNTTLSAISPQGGNWGTTVDLNTDKIEEFCFQKPYPMPLVHRSVADEGSVALSTYTASDYKWCFACCVDPASPSTNGYLVMSNGTNWIYHKSGTTVS